FESKVVTWNPVDQEPGIHSACRSSLFTCLRLRCSKSIHSSAWLERRFAMRSRFLLCFCLCPFYVAPRLARLLESNDRTKFKHWHHLLSIRGRQWNSCNC